MTRPRVKTTRERARAPGDPPTAALISFVSSDSAAVAMFDRDMVYLAASRRWMTDYRLTSSPVGRKHYQIFPEIPAAWKAVHRRCLEGATEQAEALAFPRADGRIQWVRWEGRPWRDDTGRIGGIVIVTEDVTAQRASEAAARHLASIVS